MRNEFQRELVDLKNGILKMGGVIEKTISLMIEVLTVRNAALLQEIINRDDIVDNYEKEIEKKCLTLILKQQPVAADLRLITSILKMITDLERIADQSSDIAQYLMKLTKQNGNIIKTDLSDILAMAEKVRTMVTKTIKCYINQDEKTAVQLAKEDDIIDDDFERIEERLKQQMKEDENFIMEGICYIHIIKYLERMADHATNICEWIAYQVTGEHNQYN